jgi:phosphatidylinositol-3-phosphatase
MHKQTIILAVFGLTFLSVSSQAADAANGVPRPDRVVVVIEENHSYGEIIGNPSAPYINDLAQQGALFTQSFAIGHPSEPNYLELFSGSNQGVTNDNCPFSFSTANLGAELIIGGLTFGGFSEDLPSVGYTGCTSGNYARKHNPWVNFNTGSNAVPPADNMPFAGSWPSANFANLPAVSIVVPNLINDMHDGSIAQGDSWLQNHIDSYVQWAQAHNSLLILTFDEDDGSASNQIVTIFVGPMVVVGQYAERINHYNVLRTIEEMYGLAHAGAAATATPITDCWTGSVPSPPANLTATPGNSHVSLAWSASGGAISYNVYRGTTAGGESPTPISSGSSATSYTDSSVSNGTTYYYEVTAVNANGESGFSNEASATPNAPPAAPSNLAATAVSKSQISLTWTNNDASATSISIERSTDRTRFTQVATIGGSVSSYLDTGLAKNKKYYYRVRAINGAGASAYSNTASATTLKH